LGITIHLLEEAIDAFHSSINRCKERLFLGFDGFGNARGRLAQFGIASFGRLGNGFGQLIQERLTQIHLVSVQDCSTDQTLDDVPSVFCPRINVLVNGEDCGAGVIGDPS